MMPRKPVVAALIALIALIVPGCSPTVQKRPYQQLLDRPTAIFTEKEQTFVSFFEAEPVFRFTVHNPNPIGFPVKNMTFSLNILERKFIVGTTDPGAFVRPASAAVVSLAIPLNFMDVFSTAEAFRNTPNARFDLSGKMDVGPFTVPYDLSGELVIPRIPSVSVEAMTVRRAPGPERLEMTVALENPNPFPTPPGLLEYSTTLGHAVLGEGWITPIPALDAGQKRRIVIPIESGFPRTDGALSALLKRPAVPVVLSGAIRYAVPGRGRRSFPFTSAGEVPVGPGRAG